MMVTTFAALMGAGFFLKRAFIILYLVSLEGMILTILIMTMVGLGSLVGTEFFPWAMLLMTWAVLAAASGLCFLVGSMRFSSGLFLGTFSLQ